jgi:hypothetical protein
MVILEMLLEVELEPPMRTGLNLEPEELGLVDILADEELEWFPDGFGLD